MSIKKLLIVFLCVIIPLSIFIMITAVLLNKTEQQAYQVKEARFNSYKLAEELLKSSELLTRFARTYVVTKDEKYLTYFNDVIDIRNGKISCPENYNGVYWHLVTDSLIPPLSHSGSCIPLDQQMQNAGITINEFSLLKDAQNYSNDLVHLENNAMDMIKELNKNNLSPTEMATEHLKAINMLHGTEYHHNKAIIMKPIGEFVKLLNIRTQKEEDVILAKTNRLLFILITTSMLTLLCFIFFAFIIYKKVLKRGSLIIESVQAITKGDLQKRINDKHKDELSLLSGAIDEMTNKLEGVINDANKKTEDATLYANELAIERDHSEKLLTNILPVLIADRLKKGESQIAETFPEVTVLFADIVGFTQLSAKLSPRQLVSMLNDIFGKFDELAVQFKLEKIKTIGDCYMIVGGVPERSTTHCQQVADFAIAAIKCVEEYATESHFDLNIRIGIHTGTVVAGIVGKQKYSYDLWGDVVNIASRMESSSTPGKIHITEAVKIRLADDYNLETMGDVDLKGKGITKSFYLTAKKLNRD
jgi:class 3 adenylate cyclase/HAMP domain-containing protein